MKSRFLTTALCVVIGSLGLLAACNSSTDASSGVSLDQFNALKQQVATLQGDVTALQQTVNDQQATIAKLQPLTKLKLTIGPSSASTASVQTLSYDTSSTSSVHTEAVGCTGPETYNGNSTTSDSRTNNLANIHSCAGYALIRSEALSGQDSRIQELPMGAQVFFTGTGCSGTGYVNANVLSADGVTNGTVFTMNTGAANMTGSDWSNAALYWYVAAGTAMTQNISAQSQYGFGSGCSTWDPSSPVSGYQILPNDQTVTGEPSGPTPGPYVP